MGFGTDHGTDTEPRSHYFYASLAHQFDELLWFDATSAVEPLEPARTSAESALLRGEPAWGELLDTYPFGL